MSNGLEIGLFSRPKVNLVRQSQAAECGLACLAMIAAYHGLNIDMNVLRRRFIPSTRGASLRSLMTSSDAIGLTPRAVKVELEDLGALAAPAILHWNLNHFVVLEKVSGRRALIHNPGGKSGWVSLDEVSGFFTGIALELRPSSDFEPGGVRHRLRLGHLWSGIRGLKRAVAQTVLLSLILQLFALVSPYYLQLAVDHALPERNGGLLVVLALGFGLLAVLNGVAAMLRSSVLLSAGAAFGFGLSSNIVRKLFRLPIDWFVRRNVGDILSRFQSVAPIRQLLTEDAPAALVDGALALLTLLLMFVYSPTLSIVSLTALALYAGMRWALFGAQRRAQEETIVAGGREQTILIESLHGIRALRLAGRETLRHALWQSRMTESVNGNVRFRRIANWQTVLQTSIFALENIVIIWIAVGRVMQGGFSIGMVFAYLAYKTQFLTAGASLLDKASSFRMLQLHLERLSDIAQADEDIGFISPTDVPVPLRGQIELRNIFYRYAQDDPYVLRDLSLAVAAGESVAITGPSGGGKSTLVQILLGLVEPTSGEVLIDGVPIRSFGYQNYHRQVAAVLQDDSLFAGSIADNITMFDEQSDMARIRAAAEVASIASDIEAMPMQYETLVGDMGSALSGGQRQRVLIARALYREPRVLVMDEGTSHLDDAREKQVNDAIRAMGITRIIIAHRKETILSADRVMLLDQHTLRSTDKYQTLAPDLREGRAKGTALQPTPDSKVI